MLVLSRKVGERILIGDHIAVTIVRVTGGGVRVGIEAPPEMAVLRAEIKAAAEAAAGNGVVVDSPIQSIPFPSLTSTANTQPAVVVKPAIDEAVDPPSDVPPVRKPR
jgi:carbon storage regulator